MRTTTPKVFLLAKTALTTPDHAAPLPNDYGQSIGLSKPWTTDASTDGEALIEAAGRICYKSWEPGINPNDGALRVKPK